MPNQKTSSLLATALNSLNEGFCCFDTSGRLENWNKQFSALTKLPASLLHKGYSFHEMLAYLGETSTYNWHSAAKEIYIWLSASDKRTIHTLEITDKHDHTLMLKVVIDPSLGYVFMVQDISEEYHALKMVRQGKIFLEQRVTERTSELTKVNLKLMSEIEERKVIEEALREATQEATNAHLSKTKFLAAASHDLLQPLNAARLFLTALKDHKKNTVGQKELIHSVDRAMASVEDLIGSLLDLSKLDAQAIKVRMETLPVHEILRPLHREFSAIAAAKGLRMIYVPSRAIIKTDKQLFRRIIQNLLSNAIRYTSKGRILLGVRTKNGQACIQVCDTGLGIPLNRQKEIFQEFNRLDKFDQSTGHGLGLAIVQRAVDMLKCGLHLSSTSNKGSTFGIKVPFTGRTPDLYVRPPAAQRRSITADKRSIFVLIENDHEITKAIQTLFANWGLILKCYTRGEDFFIHHHENTPPALIILDYHLDGQLNGLDFAAKLQQRWTAVPHMILSTANRSHVIEDMAKVLGVHVLHKPIRGGQLRALMESLL